MCTIEEAKKIIKDRFLSYPLEIEEISILNSINRYLAIDIEAKCDVPHFNRSIVDGYAVMSSDVMGASEAIPAYLKITSEVKMGALCWDKVKQGEAIYVPTGGVLPNGADCVVMIEDTEKINEDELFVYTKLAPKENVLFKGEDISIGETVLIKGTKICAQHLGVLSSIGYETVKVYKRLKYTVISTGDEIVSPDITPKIGEVRDINSYTITGVIKEKNSELVQLYVIKDDESLLKKAINEALDTSDIVLISGGSSVGNKDLTYQLLDEIEKGSVFVHGIAIKPGKPTIIAKVKHKLVIGLPGQPASALLVLKTFIDHIEQVFLGKSEEPLFFITATLTKNVHSTPGRETYQMVKLVKNEAGYKAEPIYGKSGTITLIASASGYIKIDANCEGLGANELVKVYKL